jgi:hypothetical protein
MPDDRLNIRDTRLRWSDNAGTLVNLNTSIMTMNVSFTSDMASQITVTVHDPAFELARNNFFAITRTVLFNPTNNVNFQRGSYPQLSSFPQNPKNSTSYPYEIASASVSPGPGASPVWTIELRPKAVQQMKRDKNPKSYKGKGSAFALSVANQYGLLPLMENTTKSVTINGASGDRRADSVWDVLNSLASEAKFRVFETDGTLVFASQKFLLGLYGSTNATVPWIDPQTNAPVMKPANFIPLKWPRDPNEILQPVAPPSVRISDNDPLDAQGSVQLDRAGAEGLRPGMTIRLQGIPMFDNLYLIDSVDYDFLGNGPVGISFRTPEREDKYIKDYEIGRVYPVNYTEWGEG